MEYAKKGKQENMQNPRVVYLKQAYTGLLVGALAYRVNDDGVSLTVAASAIAPEDRKGVWQDLPPHTEGPAAGKPRRKRVFRKRTTAEIALRKLDESPVRVPILKDASLLETNLAVFQHFLNYRGDVELQRALCSKKHYVGQHPTVIYELAHAIHHRLSDLQRTLDARPTLDTSTLLTPWNLSCHSSSSSLQLVSA